MPVSGASLTRASRSAGTPSYSAAWARVSTVELRALERSNVSTRPRPSAVNQALTVSPVP
ncbi:hypothetical protein [Lentzea jiangxiensis]|uniref:hypothetical protein n=1 Tax=Lentzea jiangxiensis TaxID=641025 RepID=UPI0015A189CF|nr:hypothetical protein [Lentzea jiangxiensis]